MRIHVSEFTVPQNQIIGPVRQGHWDEQLQAEYYVSFPTNSTAQIKLKLNSQTGTLERI